MKKYLVYPFLVVSLIFLLGACSEQTKETTTTSKKEEVTDTKENNAAESSEKPTAQWSYEGETGPEHWGELDPLFSACIQGNEQSPINIEFSQVKTSEKLENIEIQYKPTPFSIVNNGHTVLANAVTPSNSIVVEGKEYKLVQFHFHTPSEHQFNNQNFDMELHLVHQDATGKLAVLGVMIQEGKENEKLAPVWDVLPKVETEKDTLIKEPVNLQTLLPSDQTFFQYNGSLTTPPCTEEVKWVVFEKPIEMSKEQIQAFQQIFPDNHRPVLHLNKREINKN
ncbi:carbonic anhydrase [Lederbergia lenta]|uniref:carbonic anhydrase n=1 Tax=Lederbergia lenta TaxID=1467 RepID=A0A2X4W6N8_LEDLE|nr:carbonic anhydrase family protein [Lederbergia lenta]MEC2326074.1 carbonic anhydrase family protein [Lederbergia lenta]SQI53280.1 carbonic anhydrase alpha type [Lederbergia lenta]